MGTSKQLMIIWILITGFLQCKGAGKNSPPDDIGTIEALISAHKSMKKAEELAVLELTTTAATHEVTTNWAAKYNSTRKMLNQRLSDVGSYLTLASSLAGIAIQLKNLTESYAEFTETTYKKAKKQPFLLLIYTNANLQIEKEIEHIVKCCADFALFQSNVLKATMEEKRQILGFISTHIATVQRLINRANLKCRSVLAGGVMEYHVMDIIQSQTNKEIMEKIIAKWKGKKKEEQDNEEKS